MRRKLLIAIALALALAIWLASAVGAVPAPIDRWVIGSAGERVQAGTVILQSTLGEPAVGPLFAIGAQVNSGYWHAVIGSTIDVEPEPQAPLRFGLYASGPNPFTAGAAFALDLPRAAEVRAEVFGVRGNRVRVLAGAALPAGRHALVWDGRDAGGRALPSGVYLLRVRAGEFGAERKLVKLE